MTLRIYKRPYFHEHLSMTEATRILNEYNPNLYAVRYRRLYGVVFLNEQETDGEVIGIGRTWNEAYDMAEPRIIRIFEQEGM